jgi:molecular chaperone GrpE
MPEPENNDSPIRSDDFVAADEEGAAEAKPEATPEAALAAAKAEAAQNLDRYMRVAADLENFRRRTVREKDELRTLASGRVLEDIFPVIDNLALALAAARQPAADVKSLVGGVEMVLSQLKAALASHGLKEINPMGQAFDPHQHEAISHQPSDNVKAEHVMNVVRAGYSLNGRLLRPASVVVSSGPDKAKG